MTHIISGIDGVAEFQVWKFLHLQKFEGNCGLWVLNKIVKKTYPENLKKVVGAVWKLLAK